MEQFNLINLNEKQMLLKGESKNPHQLLGLHAYDIDGKMKLTICVYSPDAKSVSIAPVGDHQKKYKLLSMGEGLFFCVLPRRKHRFIYEVFCEDNQGNKWHYIDPYQFESVWSKEDISLFEQGKHYTLYKKLGAHFTTVDGVKGVSFAVWAPNAKRVSVIGTFNLWDGRRHSMRCLGGCGIWEIFIPHIELDSCYKYEIKTQEDVLLYKADPYAIRSELRPHTASRVYTEDHYKWHDKKWLEARMKKQWYRSPISIYEVHIGSWKKHIDGAFYTYRELADELVDYVKEMGYTHIELLGVLEHPFDGSWGYQVTGYFAPTSRYGTPDDFKYLIDQMHRNKIGVILDWVPAHFPKDAFGLEKFDGTALYEHFLPEQANHPQWGTLIFNYGRKEVCLFLINSALSWLSQYHIDGLRVDAVASMLYLDFGREGGDYIPNRNGGRENLEAIKFLQTLNTVVYEKFPGIMMIAEESTDWNGVTRPVSQGGLGFGFKWNMGWMNDYLKYMALDPLFRKYEHNKITFSLMYAFSENFILPFSHDEVVHGKSPMIYKMPGDEWRKFANLRVCYGYMFTHPGKKMLFMGNDFAQTREWTEKQELEWHLLEYQPHKRLQHFVKDLNTLYQEQKSLWELDDTYEGFEWIDCENCDQSIIAFMRKGKKEEDDLVIVVNFTPEVRYNYKVGVPQEGKYKEILNSDHPVYGGSGVLNEVSEAICKPWHNQAQHIMINIPPLAITIFKREKL